MRKWIIGLATVLALAGAVTTTALLQHPAHAQHVLAGLEMTVHKSPSCDCCGGWIDVMREAGVDVTSVETDAFVHVKRALSVPTTVYSCHTAEIDGYVVEGHVPVEALEQLLVERPDIRGIALGGMPAGSPGMSGTKTAPFEVVAFDAAGTRLFGRY